ncbi:unnamed protein product [Closterium sp. Naga37s-1]|nr:unnamed protein product [Closterium sp. Naga37s-1]
MPPPFRSLARSSASTSLGQCPPCFPLPFPLSASPFPPVLLSLSPCPPLPFPLSSSLFPPVLLSLSPCPPLPFPLSSSPFLPVLLSLSPYPPLPFPLSSSPFPPVLLSLSPCPPLPFPLSSSLFPPVLLSLSPCPPLPFPLSSSPFPPVLLSLSPCPLPFPLSSPFPPVLLSLSPCPPLPFPLSSSPFLPVRLSLSPCRSLPFPCPLSLPPFLPLSHIPSFPTVLSHHSRFSQPSLSPLPCPSLSPTTVPSLSTTCTNSGSECKNLLSLDDAITESRRERQQRRFEERLAIFHALATCADAPAEAAPDEASPLLPKEDLHKPESRSSGPSIPLDSYSFESHPLGAYPLSSSLLQHHPRNGVASKFDSATCGRSGRREPCDLGHVAVALRDPANAGESSECRVSPTAAKPRAPPSAERPLASGGAGAPIPAEDLQWAWRLLVVGGHAPAFDSDSARTPNAQGLHRPRGSVERGDAETQRRVSAAERGGNAGERWGGLQGLAGKKAEEGGRGIEGGAGAERKVVGLRQVGGRRTWAVPFPRGDELQAVTAAQRRQRVRRSQWLLRWLQQQQEQQQLHQHQQQQQQQQRPSCGSFEEQLAAFPLSDAELRGDGAGDRGGAGHAGVSACLGRLSLSSASPAERTPFRQLSPFEATGPSSGRDPSRRGAEAWRPDTISRGGKTKFSRKEGQVVGCPKTKVV